MKYVVSWEVEADDVFDAPIRLAEIIDNHQGDLTFMAVESVD